ncbi:MAG: hypothetical protein JWQ72_3974 [Polaromonas sp.]|nr:hypothetical protein [Polaromonas sp.]
MKVTIQNGAAHGLSRRDVETIVPLFPETWSAVVQQIVLYQAKGPNVNAKFFPKAQLLGFFWPVDVESVSEANGLEELLVALSVAAETGEIPEKLSKSARDRHAAEVAGVLANCLTALERKSA